MSHHSYSSCCVHQCLGRCTPRCHEPRSCYRSCVRFQAVAVDGVGISIFNRYRSSCCCRCLVSTVRLPSAATAAAAAASFSSCQNACSTWFLQLLLLAKLVLPFVVAAARHLLAILLHLRRSLFLYCFSPSGDPVVQESKNSFPRLMPASLHPSLRQARGSPSYHKWRSPDSSIQSVQTVQVV